MKAAKVKDPATAGHSALLSIDSVWSLICVRENLERTVTSILWIIGVVELYLRKFKNCKIEILKNNVIYVIYS